jgi:aminoglycoside phosphotransferase (APT) family kinase protein
MGVNQDNGEPERLKGGLNEVIRVGATVIRPTRSHSASVHSLLQHLESVGFDGAPRFISVDADHGTETVSFLDGETTDYPLAETFRTGQAMVSAAKLLRRLHDATTGFDGSGYPWFLPARSPVEVICHGDFAPYNCVIRDGEVVGVFDFDTAHPGPRLWDLGYLAYRWVPLVSPLNLDGFGTLTDQGRRLPLLCAAYGTDRIEEVLDQAHQRVLAMVDTIRSFAAAGHAGFQAHIDEGHDELYLRDARHIADNKAQLLSAP